MLGTRGRSKSPEARLESVQGELSATSRDLEKLEQDLGKDSHNPFLLKKYERLSKKEQLLLEERKLWAGAALQNQSWQAGLQAAPGVKALLSRLVLASSPQAELEQSPEVQRAVLAAQIADPAQQQPHGGRNYGTWQASQQSPDKAQLMLLANAADATGQDNSPGAFDQMLSGYDTEAQARQYRTNKRRADKMNQSSKPGLPLPPVKRGAFGTGFKPFHVARNPPVDEDSEEGMPMEVPVTLNLEDRLADYASDILAGKPRAMYLDNAHLGEAWPANEPQQAKAGSRQQGQEASATALQAEQSTQEVNRHPDGNDELKAEDACKSMPAAEPETAGALQPATTAVQQGEGANVPAQLAPTGPISAGTSMDLSKDQGAEEKPVRDGEGAKQAHALNRGTPCMNQGELGPSEILGQQRRSELQAVGNAC